MCRQGYEQLEKENAFLRSRLNDLKGDCAFYEQQLQEIGKQLIDTESKCELYKGMIPSEDMRFKARRYDGLRYSRLFACYLSGIFSANIFITCYQYPDTIGGLFQWYFIPMIFGFLFGSLVLFFLVHWIHLLELKTRNHCGVSISSPLL